MTASVKKNIILTEAMLGNIKPNNQNHIKSTHNNKQLQDFLRPKLIECIAIDDTTKMSELIIKTGDTLLSNIIYENMTCASFDMLTILSQESTKRIKPILNSTKISHIIARTDRPELLKLFTKECEDNINILIWSIKSHEIYKTVIKSRALKKQIKQNPLRTIKDFLSVSITSWFDLSSAEIENLFSNKELLRNFTEKIIDLEKLISINKTDDRIILSNNISDFINDEHKKSLLDLENKRAGIAYIMLFSLAATGLMNPSKLNLDNGIVWLPNGIEDLIAAYESIILNKDIAKTKDNKENLLHQTTIKKI